MHCTLLVPDLLPPGRPDAPDQGVRAPQLATLLARGDTVEIAASCPEQWLCEAFDVRPENDWPVAPLTLAADGGTPGGDYWLRCDPVHLQILRNRMRLGVGIDAPDAAESQALVAALNGHFVTDGLLFVAGACGRWYVRTESRTAVKTCPPGEAARRDIDACIPSGTDSQHWRGVVNEIQMLLHAHPVNTARETRGLPAFNSVWLWGGGRIPATIIAPFARVWTDDVLARGLALRANIPVAAPTTADAVFGAGDNALVALTATCDTGSEPAAWRDVIGELERRWFAPCRRALQERRLDHLSIVVPGAPVWRRVDITRSHLRRWWRRPREFSRHG